MDRLEDWRRLCALIDDDAAVSDEVTAGVIAGEEGWEALIGSLDDAGALAYLRADDTGMELSDALAQLPRIHRLQLDLDEVTDTDDLEEAMRVADALLRPSGLRLLRLVEEDDDGSWPVVVVREADAVPAVDLAARLGHRAVTG